MMQVDRLADTAIDYLLGRVMRRAAAPFIGTLCTFVAAYYFTVAGAMALDEQYGALYGRLIVACVYAAIALITAGIWWAAHARSTKATAVPALENGREMQVAMLVEAVMLGYALAHKRERAS